MNIKNTEMRHTKPYCFLSAAANGLRSTAGRFLLGLLLAAGAVGTAQAQTASGQITLLGGSYNYSMVVSNASSASSPIGSFWFGWIPGENYLLNQLSSVGLPTGWSDNPQGGPGAYSMQFTALSSADYIAPGSSETFTFTSADSPTVLASDTVNYSDDNPLTTTVAYPAGLFSSGGDTFSFAVSVPEPSTWALAALGGLFLATVARRRLRPAEIKAGS